MLLLQGVLLFRLLSLSQWFENQKVAAVNVSSSRVSVFFNLGLGWLSQWKVLVW